LGVQFHAAAVLPPQQEEHLLNWIWTWTDLKHRSCRIYMEKRNSLVLSGHSAVMKFSDKHQNCSSYFGFYSGAHGVFVLQGYDSAFLGHWSPTFRRCCPLSRLLSGPQGCSGRFGEQKSPLPLPWFETRAFQPVN